MCVMPAGLTSSSRSFSKFISLPKVNEMELISAILSGHLDPSIMASAPGNLFAPIVVYVKLFLFIVRSSIILYHCRAPMRYRIDKHLAVKIE